MRWPLELDEEAWRGLHEVVVERIKAHGLAE